MKYYFYHKLSSLILIGLFGFLIYTPFIMAIIEEDLVASSMEKRNLATLPQIPHSLNSVKEYPSLFDTYYSDHFGYREVLTKVYFQITNTLNRTASIDDVTVGNDGWVFLGGVRPGPQKHHDPMGDAMHVNLFTDSDLDAAVRSIVSTKNWLKSRGVEYIYP